MKFIPLFFCIFCLCETNAQVPVYGASGQTDLASWNLMWYGHAAYGSANKPVQRAAIAEVLRNSKVDIWFFQEICDTGDFSGLLEESGSFEHVYASYWQDQKTAWAWDSSQWTRISDSMLFRDYTKDFASGRLPLFVCLVAKDRPDTLFLLGIHLKAHTGTDTQKEQAYINRKAAAQHLGDWHKLYPDRKVIIAGDWNDGIDKSLFKDTLSPFVSLRQEGHFLLEKQVVAGEKTWYYGTSCIDHIWVNSLANSGYKKGSALILPLDWYFPSYPEIVSDHFPVFASFEHTGTQALEKAEARCPGFWPNPSRGDFYREGIDLPSIIDIRDLQGKKIPFTPEIQGDRLRISIHLPGIYFVFLEEEGHVFVYRLVVNP